MFSREHLHPDIDSAISTSMAATITTDDDTDRIDLLDSFMDQGDHTASDLVNAGLSQDNASSDLTGTVPVLSPESPVEPSVPQTSGLDLAVQYLLPAEVRNKYAFDATALHRMDLKFVKTASGEMITGDTLVVINVPRGHIPNYTCTGSFHQHQYRLRISSTKLRHCGFDLFPRLLDDIKYQTKTMRRFAAKNGIPPDVKHILDLGPSIDEDLQSTHLETLSLSKGLIRWYMTAEIPPHVDVELVAGHDDCCKCAGAPNSDSDAHKKHNSKGSIWRSEAVTPAYRHIEDYCEARHAANVVRLLRAVAGVPGCRLLLNSAPRVFTLAGLAKLFELNLSAESAWLRNDILNWLTKTNNSMIMEVLTEEAIIMAYSLKISKVARVTYRLLVSEHALQLESGVPTQRGGRQFSVFGRPLRDINDDAIQTAVEHGGQALAERISETIQHLQSDEVLHWLGMKVWRTLENTTEDLMNFMTTEEAGSNVEAMRAIQEAFVALKFALNISIRQRVGDAASINERINPSERYVRNMSHYKHYSRTVNFDQIWRGLNTRQKQLTGIFWDNLKRRWPAKLSAMSERRKLESLALHLQKTLLKWGSFADEGWQHPYPQYIVDIELLIEQLEDEMRFKVWNPITGRWAGDPELELLTMSSHLLRCLEEDEMRFLPLWADGLNDESGGVYNNTIPPDMSDTAPIRPGPSYVTGHSRATEATDSTVGDLDLDDLDIQSIATMTETNAAGRATCSTVVDSQVGGVDDADFQQAQYAIPAGHQPVAVGVFGLVESVDGSSVCDDFGTQSNSTAQHTPTASVTGTDTGSQSSDWVMT